MLADKDEVGGSEVAEDVGEMGGSGIIISEILFLFLFSLWTLILNACIDFLLFIIPFDMYKINHIMVESNCKSRNQVNSNATARIVLHNNNDK